MDINLNIKSKIFKRITNDHNLFQPQQQTQATNIQERKINISIKIACTKGTSEKKITTLTQNSQDKIHYIH